MTEPQPRTAELMTELTITFGAEYTHGLACALEQAGYNNQADYRKGLDSVIDVLVATGIPRPAADAVVLGHVLSFLAVLDADAAAEEQRAKWTRN